ncbi:hypothetical protein [Streptomyces griseoloalbus]|uniref:Uncharacterized protein n=2 Tax=Streptomycetaceae TaxID=2062 RepID=A0A7W8BTJ2_9ACTN|nr:hypothetical protein [Streptomyces albaduncus]MBB5128468.1 hypothetical protein [Streptomyces albaduncus]GGW68117.1 hypothetical protein GCM10010340_52800 [Streptomyces albaduncus]
MSITRTFTRAQLDALGLPDDTVYEDQAAEFPTTAVELHREQVDTRRWVSVHALVFRAPDDGKTYRVRYEEGLTENQDGTDPWMLAAEVEAVEVEEYDRTIKAWRPVGEQPAADQPRPHPNGFAALADQDEARLAVLDGRDVLAFVIIRPAGDDLDRIAVEASARGMSKAVAAYALRQTADQFDAAAIAEGDTPITAEEAAAEQQQRAAVPDRPALALLTEIYEELGHDHRSMPLAAALLDQYARELAEQVTALGKARGWSTWAADYIHPDREFVDTGEDVEEEQPTAVEEPRTPHVGDRYVSRTDAARTVTVNRVWTADDGHTGVAFEWGYRGECGSALNLNLFHAAYAPEAQR